ncbi:MAG: ankyrin repeat domain-containing protein [Nitrospirota bacterium]
MKKFISILIIAVLGLLTGCISPLATATYKGQMDMVRELLNNKDIDINEITACDMTSPTMGYTPLMCAVEGGHVEIVKLLLSKGADVNTKSSRGTALHVAVERGHAEIVRLLLDNGADLSIIGSPGPASNSLRGTPLQIAQEKGQNTIIARMLMEAEEKQFKKYTREDKKTLPALTIFSPLQSDMGRLNIADSEKIMGENDLAVIIGIESYKGLPKSDYSKSDAGLVKDYLKELGFKERNIEFITDSDATKSSIEKSLEAWLPNRIKKDSRVFVYYSGHGAPEPKTGDAYLVPYDGDPNYLEVTGYPLKRLYDNLGKLKVAEVVVVLDSCFSGAGGRSVLAKGTRPLVMMTDIKTVPSNMAILSATQGTQISTSSTEKGHGVFTYYFLRAIKDGKKTIADIYEYIKPMVEDEAKTLNVQQSPSISPDAEKLKGRFILRR